MKKLLFLSILIISVTMSSVAQDKASDLKKLFALMDTEKMVDGMMDNMIPALKQQASGQIKGDDAEVKFNTYMDFMMNEVKKLSIKLVNEEMVNIYDKHFTQDEIKDLIKFYESPTGKKLLETTPEISKDLMNSMMTNYMPEFQEKLTNKLYELK
ncbi:MAG: DUF2059 domain-containing protein [Bacteroidales bacterium]|nr:DUF2059 domain-containing protein [Bacteroidales bacterium]